MIALIVSDRTAWSIFFCVAQVTLFAAVGTLATRWLAAYRPRLALSVAYAILIVIALLTITIPVAVPRWMVV